MLAVKNSTKRSFALSPAAATSVGEASAERKRTSWFMIYALPAIVSHDATLGCRAPVGGASELRLPSGRHWLPSAPLRSVAQLRFRLQVCESTPAAGRSIAPCPQKNIAALLQPAHRVFLVHQRDAGRSCELWHLRNRGRGPRPHSTAGMLAFRTQMPSTGLCRWPLRAR